MNNLLIQAIGQLGRSAREVIKIGGAVTHGAAALAGRGSGISEERLKFWVEFLGDFGLELVEQVY